MKDLSNMFLQQQSQNAMEMNTTGEKIAALQKNIMEMNEAFLKMEGSKKNEIETTSQAFVSWQEKNKQLLLAMQSDLKEIKDNYLSRNPLKNFNPVNIELGPLPSGKPPSLNYKLPSDIPDSAREILVYAYVATDLAKGGVHNFKIAVKIAESKEAVFYLYANADTKPGWSYNSENMWLPMPVDRELVIYTEGTPLYGNWTSAVKIIAYR